MSNLQRALKKWGRLSRVFRREGADSQTLKRINVVVVKEVPLYGLEMLVMTTRIGRVLGGFNHRVPCRLKGWKPRIGKEGRWVYPLLVEAMAESGL